MRACESVRVRVYGERERERERERMAQNAGPVALHSSKRSVGLMETTGTMPVDMILYLEPLVI